MRVLEFLTSIAIILIVYMMPIAAWITHIWRCFTTGEWGFLVAGAIFFPIAVVHGIGIWFGAW